jgi:hypothetical protein
MARIEADVVGSEPGEPGGPFECSGDRGLAVGGDQLGDDDLDLFGQHRHPGRRAGPDERLRRAPRAEEGVFSISVRALGARDGGLRGVG